MGDMTSWIFIIVIFAVMYFLMIRPQNQRDKEAKQMRNNLKPGDQIITIGGICGTVARVKEDSDRVVIMVGAERTKLEILKSAIAQKDGEEAKPTKATKTEEEPAAKPNKKNIKRLGAAEEAPAEKAEAQSEAPAEKAE